jgi:Domain of unknown function (DUF4279)
MPFRKPRRPAQADRCPRVSARSTATHKEALWSLSASEDIEDDEELAVQLERLLAVLEPRANALWELADGGYEANWYCWVESHATEHAVEIERQILARLLALPGDLWLDVCGEGEDE